jgi:D-tyrosyl-tRNA(Tyr) deacylase
VRAVLQRVTSARVAVGERLVGEIGHGLLALVGVEAGDGPPDVEWTADRIRDLRVFADDQGRMNRSIADARGAVLLVSQFTLLGDCRKGRRPSFDRAAAPDDARRIYESLADALRQRGLPVETGEFQALMQVSLTNDGPVTLIVDSRRRF